MDKNMSLVNLTNIKKYFKRGTEIVHAVDGVNFSIKNGDFLSIVGPSGSGKTTLLNIIGCVENPSEGKIEIENNDVTGAKQSELTKIRRNVIGFVFQQFFLIPTLTASENVQVPGLFAKKTNMKERANELLDMVGLSNRVNHLPSQLSGGEMQRVAIARALINSPKLILADEPTGNLDTKNAEIIFNTFSELNKNGIAVVIVTHSMRLAKLCNNIIQIENGKIIDE